MKFIICDDDLTFGNRIKSLIERYAKEKVLPIECVVFENARQIIGRSDIDTFVAAFLDAKMEPIDGIMLGKYLKKKNREILVVFVSSYLEFALPGYTVEAFRYLLKSQIEEDLRICLDDLLERVAPSHEALWYKYDGEMRQIPYRDIYYCESNLRKISVYGEVPGEVLASFYQTLSSLNETLKEHDFLQIGKSDIVNMMYIRTFANYQVTLKNGVVKNVRREKFSGLRNYYVAWKGKIV